MSGRITLTVLLAVSSAAARAQPSVPPDRAAELMQLQFSARTTRPPPDSMDGPRASVIYKRFSEPAAHGGPAPGAAGSGTGTAQQ